MNAVYIKANKKSNKVAENLADRIATLRFQYAPKWESMEINFLQNSIVKIRIFPRSSRQ